MIASLPWLTLVTGGARAGKSREVAHPRLPQSPRLTEARDPESVLG
jgi:hypothetical protein